MRGKRLSREAALRIGAVALVAVAAIAFLPGLLSPPEAPPLPDDVGLGATGVDGVVAEAPVAREQRPPEKRRPAADRAEAPMRDAEPARGNRESEPPRKG